MNIDLPNQNYYQSVIDNSTLINADCFDILPFVPDKSIDAIIADLPYGKTRNKWDSILPLDKLWAEYKRILKDKGVVVLFASQPFTSILVTSNLSWFKYDWAWKKEKGTGHLNAKKQPLRDKEDILVFYQKQPTYNPQMTKGESYKRIGGSKNSLNKGNYGKTKESYDTISEGYRYPKTIQFFPSDSQRFGSLHPTQKPTELMEYLIKTYTNEGDMVLDNVMGSGTTNLAAMKLNRKSIGIEKDQQYYNIAVQRLLEYSSQNDIK